MLYRHLFGKENIYVVSTLEHVGNVYWIQYRHDKVIVLLEELLHIRINIIGPYNVIIALILHSLDSIFLKRRKFHTYVKLYNNFILIQRSKLWLDSINWMDSLTHIVSCFN